MGLSNKNRALDSCILRMRLEWIDGLRTMFARNRIHAAFIERTRSIQRTFWVVYKRFYFCSDNSGYALCVQA